MIVYMSKLSSLFCVRYCNTWVYIQPVYVSVNKYMNYWINTCVHETDTCEAKHVLGQYLKHNTCIVLQYMYCVTSPQCVPSFSLHILTSRWLEFLCWFFASNIPNSLHTFRRWLKTFFFLLFSRDWFNHCWPGSVHDGKLASWWAVTEFVFTFVGINDDCFATILTLNAHLLTSIIIANITCNNPYLS